MTLSIITVNYNGLDDTSAMLASIPPMDGMEVIVVDNGSANDEAAILRQRHPAVTVIRSPKNLGFAGGNNLGIEAASGKYLFFVNNDTLFPPTAEDGTNWFQPLIRRLEAQPSTAVVCPKIRFSWDEHPIQFAGFTPLSSITLRNSTIGLGEADHGQHDTPHPTPYAHGAAMMIRREAISKAGIMPEAYFLYYEEIDWSVRFHSAGYDIWYDPASTIFHKESRTTGQGSPLRTYYVTRNRLLFARRNVKSPRRYLTYLYLMLIVAPRDLLKHLFQRQTKQANAVLNGIVDFIRGRQGRQLTPST